MSFLCFVFRILFLSIFKYFSCFILLPRREQSELHHRDRQVVLFVPICIWFTHKSCVELRNHLRYVEICVRATVDMWMVWRERALALIPCTNKVLPSSIKYKCMVFFVQRFRRDGSPRFLPAPKRTVLFIFIFYFLLLALYFIFFERGIWYSLFSIYNTIICSYEECTWLDISTQMQCVCACGVVATRSTVTVATHSCILVWIAEVFSLAQMTPHKQHETKEFHMCTMGDKNTTYISCAI